MNSLSQYETYPKIHLGEMPFLRSIFRVRIPPKQLTRLRSSAIITGYKRRQYQGDTLEFKQTIFLKSKGKFKMYKFHVNGDVGRHFISISGAAAECGISISTINRQEKKGEFPPKQKLGDSKVVFLVYQVEQWLQGQRGGWK